MYYSCFALLAIVLIVIVNYDILIKNEYSELLEGNDSYRQYLVGCIVFFATDSAWGFLYQYHCILLCYLDTVVYNLALVSVVFLWARYIVIYLGNADVFGKVFDKIGILLVSLVTVLLIVNAFYPIMFSFDAGGEYQTHIARYFLLVVQAFFYCIVSVYSIAVSFKGINNFRYRTVGGVGVLVSMFSILQMYLPLVPFTSIGYMIGIILLHTFVLEELKKEQNERLKMLLDRERKQFEELEQARQKAYIDQMTGVHNKRAYYEYAEKMDERIRNHEVEDFGVIVFDLNNLKMINDRYGHEAGDNYIKHGCKMICKKFAHSPVFRIGGDEFVAILEGSDYESRKNLLASFDAIIDENNLMNGVVIASGLAEYRIHKDERVKNVFDRADKRMYERKIKLKANKFT